jgi:hypothetical protein
VLEVLERSDDGIVDSQVIKAAGLTSDGVWAYVGATPAARGGLPGRYVLWRENNAGTAWTLISFESDGVRYRRCLHKVPADLRPLLVRDRFRCV